MLAAQSALSALRVPRTRIASPLLRTTSRMNLFDGLILSRSVHLVYPEFDSDPHPALLRCIRLSLRTRELHSYEYGDPKKGTGTASTRSQSPFSGSDNPPILHRKETFLSPDHPLFAKFARLTQQEEQHGLYAETATIGTRAGWQARLTAAGLTLRGHRLVRGG
jgi:hypothetical protein